MTESNDTSASSSYQLPDAVELAHLPTPLRPLPRLSEQLGCDVLCKRDDLTGSALSGNKIRKLEFLLADALDSGAKGVVTCGGEQSNHCRATALAAAQLGLACHLLLRTSDPENPPPADGNILLDRLAGASIEWITPEQYAKREELLQQVAKRVGGEQPYYIVPEGGSNALGAWGYVRCVQELASQLGSVPATIICAVGSGGTLAGLIAGCKLHALPYRIIGICVCDDRPTFQRRVVEILDQMAEQFGIDVRTEAEGVEVWDGYVGRGYALSQPEELQTIIDVTRSEGLVLDPVYTGKAMHGLLDAAANKPRLAAPIVFLHTGGIFGLASKRGELSSLW